MSFSQTSTVPIELLPGIGNRTAKVLHNLSVHTVGQFKQLPEQVLVELFGPSIRQVHSIVRGYQTPIKVTPTITTTKTSWLKKLRRHLSRLSMTQGTLS